MLAAVTRPDQPGAGWRTVALTSPVRLTPDTTYVVSYFSADGNYANDDRFFAADYASSPLHVKAGGGAYAYAAQTQLPNVASTANYWADVVFAPDDDSGPLVGAVAPADGATSIPVTTAVTATLDEAVDPTTANVGVRAPAPPAPRCPRPWATTPAATPPPSRCPRRWRRARCTPRR